MGELLQEDTVKRSVFSRKGKGVLVCQQTQGHNPITELLIRKEEINGGVEFLKRLKEMEARE